MGSNLTQEQDSIGKLNRVPLRRVWPNEAANFTPWLSENIDVLNEVLDITLSSVESEQAAGSFSVDLVAESDSGGTVVIENQLGRSDHDHLGKLLTYLTAIEANAAVWIVADPRPEHVRAVSWLNETPSASFYLVKVEAVEIGESDPAPLLTLIVGPSAETRGVGKTKEDLAERYPLRFQFWTGLLQKARTKTQLHANISPGQQQWVGTSAGINGLMFSYVIRQHDGNVELYIDYHDEEEGNNRIFDRLAESRQAIESAYGGPLGWQRLEGKRACRIRADTDIGGYRDEENWGNTQNAMIDSMIRLDAALRPHLQDLQI